MAPAMEYREIQEPVLPLLQAAERMLAREIGSQVKLIGELGRGTPVAGGKKIRAVFFFLLARLSGARDEGLADLGAAIEMLHLSSLVHDDIVDHSSRRRGRQTPNHHFGDSVSVLWGDFLFITSIRMLTRAARTEAVSILAETSRRMIEGQVLEYANNFNYRLDARTYTDIIGRKTASLFEGIAVLAAGPGNRAAAADVKAFCRFGRDFGMIFQVSDDLLDIFSQRSGKGRFQDLKEGKVTLPYIRLIAGGGLRLIRSFDPARPEPLLARGRRWGVRAQSLAIVDRHARRCREFLQRFPPSPERDSLAGLVDFIRRREY